MTLIDLMNENSRSEMTISEVYKIAEYMNVLNNMDEETWRQTREAMADGE